VQSNDDIERHIDMRRRRQLRKFRDESGFWYDMGGGLIRALPAQFGPTTSVDSAFTPPLANIRMCKSASVHGAQPLAHNGFPQRIPKYFSGFIT